jgi:hypothetical protein
MKPSILAKTAILYVKFAKNQKSIFLLLQAAAGSKNAIV